MSRVLILLVALTNVAHAQESAAEAFGRATEAFDARRFADALEGYRAAFAIDPHVDTRFNIAACLEELDRHREALMEFEAAATEAPTGSPQRAEALSRAEAARRRLGRLEVELDPAVDGVPVLIDGAALCTTPCRMDLDPGAHVVLVETEHGRATAEAQITQGEVRSVRLRLIALAPSDVAPEVLDVEAPSDPIGAGVWATMALTLASTGATVGLGLRTQHLGDRYEAAPSEDLQDRGRLMRGLTNAALGFAIVSAIVTTIVLILDRR